ncbi:MAG: hypothetical protein JJU02_09685 [Cryomorphaceae bacterium]|nr:hypothetical protein [Cryomorphaceae bacterium]
MSSVVFRYLPVLIALTLSVLACRRGDNFAESGVKLTFSADTIYLDTVFSTVGSSTRVLKVFNPSSDAVNIDQIFLGRGQQSFYRLNINGNSAKSDTDVEILPRDSMYIFIEITGNTQAHPDPIYEDSIIFINKGETQWVNLVTLVQDAHFIYPTRYFTDSEINYSVFPCDTTFNSHKPVVIYGYAVVDANCELIIQDGAQFHFHKNSGLWVFNGGSLKVNPGGVIDYDNPVVFQGDRLEPFYKEIPGQWGGALGGIYIMGNSVNNIINNAVIKNGTIGLVADSTIAANPNLHITNTRFYNFSRAGIFGGYGNFEAENVVAANCGLYTFYALGGRYSFIHSTFANYWNQSSRSTPAIGLFNFFETPDNTFEVRDISKAYFGNCIIYGSNVNELGINQFPGTNLEYTFNRCILKIHPDTAERPFDITNSQKFQQPIVNQNPDFIDPLVNDYQLESTSPAIGTGNTDGTNVFFDIKGESRTPLPDIGAYQFKN